MIPNTWRLLKLVCVLRKMIRKGVGTTNLRTRGGTLDPASLSLSFSLSQAPGLCEVQPRRMRRRLGARGVRIGEASHPGPARAALAGAALADATARWKDDAMQQQRAESAPRRVQLYSTPCEFSCFLRYSVSRVLMSSCVDVGPVA